MIGQKNRRFRQCLSIILTLLLLVTAVPMPVRAKVAENEEVDAMQAIDSVEVAATSEKITKDVKEEMQAGDRVEIIVYMKDKLDSIAFAEKALAKHSLTMSKYDANLQVRRDLVLALKDQTHRTQYSLRQLVEKSADKVQKFESYFIANVAFMEVNSELVQKIAALPEVEKITKNNTYYLEDYRVDETDVTMQADENLWSLEMVHAPETWGIGIDGTGAVVGLLDSGADYNHPALKNKWRGLAADGKEDATYSWYDTVANKPLPIDSDTHGTHVCGTMVGEDEEAGIITGVAPGAKWICARVFDESGRTTDDKLLNAAQWMLAPGNNPDMAPDVVNNSWGGGPGMDDWYISAVDSYVAAGIVPVFSAGNQRQGEPLPGPGSITVPSNYEKSLAVAAIDQNKIRASFSKRGPSPYTDNWKPEMSAPGVGITSSMSGGTYGTMSGTSMSAPHISGSIALLRSANQALTVQEIRNLLYTHAEPLTDDDPNAQTSPNYDYGYGLVDTFDMVAPIADNLGTFIGKVMQEGNDKALPVIDYEQTVFEIYIGESIPVEAYISDDISLVNVALMVKPEGEDWQELTFTQIDGDIRSGNYTGIINPTDMGNGNFQYKIVAEDYVGNVVEAGPYSVVLNFGIVPGDYLESFEGSAIGWRMDPLWEVGAPSEEEEPEPYDGDQCIATVIGGKYGAKEDAYLISIPIDMRNTSEASVRFKHWYNFTGGTSRADYGEVFVTNDYGKTLTEIDKYELNSEDWLGKVIDLRPYAYSETPVFIVFHFVSNAVSHHYGWYIDLFSIEGKDTTAPDAPTNLEAQPGITSFNLSWDFEMVDDFEEFEIYRSTAAGELGKLVGTTTYQNYRDSYDSGIEDDVVYYYTVKARDMFDNRSNGSNQVSVEKTVSNVIVSWDFEENDGGFTTGMVKGKVNDWEWGNVDPKHGPGAAFTGSKVWATGLSKNYSSWADAYLQTPQITLPAEGANFLTMNHWHFFEMATATGRKWDYGQVLAKAVDSEDWINVTPADEGEEEGEGKIGGPKNTEPKFWSNLEIDLSQFSGQTIEVRFFYHSDGSGERDGWFINNVDIVNVASSNSTSALSYEYKEDNNKEYKIADFSLDMTNVGREAKSDYVSQGIDLDTIPIKDARVSVVESGRSVAVDNRTSNYRMLHPASEEGATWTLKAEAYGYVSEYYETELLPEQTVIHNFVLDKKATGSISGQVYDRYSHEPAPFATVTLVEDPNVAPVVADEEGHFTFEQVYVGDYTLHASAENFESGASSVTVVADEDATCNIPLKRFVGAPGEIRYDDGTAENATVLVREGGGIAMRFTPERFGKLLSASFYFWDTSWPKPGGNEIGFGVFVQDGAGYKQIGETKVRDDIVRGDWYTIDLSDLNFTTDEDFYVTTIQTKDGDHSPGHGLDESAAAEASERSYFFVDGDFQDFPSQDYAKYGAMIRATLEYAVESPTITNLDEVNYTNQDSIAVEGLVDYDQGQVLVYANDELVKVIEPEDFVENTFATTIDLIDEETNVKVAMKVGDKETEPTQDKLVIKDQIAPELTVIEPYDGELLNTELVHVIGSAIDKYFDKLTINGVEVDLNDDGSYDFDLLVDSGANPIEIRAIDKAGNETTENLTVYVRLDEDIKISDMKPESDVVLKAGETTEVSFRAAAGGNASYRIWRPSGLQNVNLQSIPMEEVEAGYYKAYVTAGEIAFENAKVYFNYDDAYGNRAQAVAPGTISVIKAELIERLEGSNRYKTAVLMSQKMYEQADTVILASGVNFPDALVGGAYSEEIDAPILLTRQTDLPAETLAEIERLGAREVKILGGPLAISETVENKLLDEGLELERIAGSNRYKTAVAISDRYRSKESKHAFLVSGERYEDALSIVPVAAQEDEAILLTNPNSLHRATRRALSDWGIESVTIMGGPLAISKEVEQELKDVGYIVTREAGSNAYATNISIAMQYFPQSRKAIGVSGADFPDAMISASFAAMENRPIILLDPDGLRDDTIMYFENQAIETVLIVGGELAVPRAIEYHIRALLEK